MQRKKEIEKVQWCAHHDQLNTEIPLPIENKVSSSIFKQNGTYLMCFFSRYFGAKFMHDQMYSSQFRVNKFEIAFKKKVHRLCIVFEIVRKSMVPP